MDGVPIWVRIADSMDGRGANSLLRWASCHTPAVDAGENITLIAVLTGVAASAYRTHNR
jgi:hypothetical protein